MIPELPPTIKDEERLEFYNAIWSNLSDQSSVHVNWHTHRGNPSVCWICDLFTLTSKILDMYDKNITKSPLDMETEYSSVRDSDSEIETSTDEVDDNTNEPEYDIEDDEC